MCGIAGFSGTPDHALLQSYLRKLVHRGPDSEGYYEDDAVSLGVRRLRIIDLVTGDQPIHNEDGTVWIVFNGEVYNYRELRKELEERGHRFYTLTDTETVVHLYEEKREAVVDDLRGMFAFALYDSKESLILLARDRFGKKPLYYYVRNEGKERTLRFASELKTLMHADFQPSLNWAAAAYYLTYLYNPLEESMISGILRLPPGHVLKFDLKSGALSKKQYWDIDYSFADELMTVESAMNLIHESLSDAVKRRMIADVPVGAFLSGGVDSSVVCALMANAGARIKTFSVGYTSRESEHGYAAKVASLLGTDHKEFIIGDDILGSLPEVVAALDEPIGDPSILPTYFLSKQARLDVTVALTGDGGDEAFYGYPWFNTKLKMYFGLPGPVRKIAGTVAKATMGGAAYELEWYESSNYRSLPFEEQVALRFCHFNQGEVSRLLGRPVPDPSQPVVAVLRGTQDLPLLRRIAYFGVKRHLPDDFLAKNDQLSMAHSLEQRSPMLDHVFFSQVAVIPDAMKQNKLILKKYAVDRLLIPRRVIFRKKGGFSLPLAEWSRQLAGSVPAQSIGAGKPTGYRSSLRVFGLAVFNLWKERLRN